MNIKKMSFGFRFSAVIAILSAAIACEVPPSSQSNAPQMPANNNANTTVANTAPAPSASPVENKTETANAAPVTLPVLDAMFADEKFSADLKSKLSLTDEQITKLKTVAREATANLTESESGSTNAATKSADEQIRGIIGEGKAKELAKFVSEHWEKDESGTTTAANNSGANKPNSVPTDTRIVVNAPAYRMDVFKDGQLVKTYKIGIGYPEFPLPVGMRKAETIIFNPTWTPPDEPWVKGKIEAGKKVAAGDKLNPLGPIKIPIGSPSLIHGGKAAARLGGFASHGCVGLTNPQVQDFAAVIAAASGTELKPEDVKMYEKNKTETKNVKLNMKMPVELRYETIIVENGQLKIFRDVYERGTNTEENLKKVLEANGAPFDSLPEADKTKILAALKQMARDSQGNEVEIADPKAKKNTSLTTTRTIKGAKEAVFKIAALAGKGYPAPKDLNTGGGAKK